MTDPVILFRDAMQGVFGQLDLLPIADGTIHRFYVSGDKAGSKNGWYILYLDRIASGAFGSWKSGCSHTWSSRKPTDSIEAQLIAQGSNQARQQRKAEQTRKQLTAAESARRLWSWAGMAQTDHSYTNCKRTCKSLASNNLRQVGEVILVPLYAEGLLMNLQRIYPDGTKRFMYGGKVRGCYSAIGEFKEGQPFYICEGWATGATIHQFTGCLVLCAMNAGNLLEVAQQARKDHPNAHIIIAGDNDHNTLGNPGVKAARHAALAVEAEVIIPEFPAGHPGTDWNDYYLMEQEARQ